MHRRILAALAAALAVLILLPARLGGETATSSAPTTSVGGFLDMPTPNPLSLYPRRPGARYEDVEVPPHAVGRVPLANVKVAVSAIEPRGALPRPWSAAKVTHYKKLGLVDGYAPIASDTTGDVLHVVLHETHVDAALPLTCVATSASDGTVLVPFARHPLLPLPTESSKHTWAPFDVDLYFPLGARRGRLYLECTQTLFAELALSGATVWAIDV